MERMKKSRATKKEKQKEAENTVAVSEKKQPVTKPTPSMVKVEKQMDVEQPRYKQHRD